MRGGYYTHMSDDDASFVQQLRGLAGDWVQNKRMYLKAPETRVDSISGRSGYQFDGQTISIEDMREIRRMRESGGILSQLMHAKALLNFGGGTEFRVHGEDQTEIIDGEEETLSHYLQHLIPDLDLLALELGEDAIWYPYAAAEIVENNAGGFSRILPIEPWTLTPTTDEYGRITSWEQTVRNGGGAGDTIVLDPDDIIHFRLNKSSARDHVGISEVLRNRDEIEYWKSTQRAINQAIELHGFPQRHIKVGREGGAPIRDDELRRVRNLFNPDTTDANTAYFTGQDVDIETLEAHNFDYKKIQEMSLTNLTAAVGMPIEAVNVGREGLGSGKPAEVRLNILKLQIRANQMSFGRQWVEEVVRPLLRDYSPFDHTADIELRFSDPLESMSEQASFIREAGAFMTANEARKRLGLEEQPDLDGVYGPPTDAVGGGESADDVPDSEASTASARSLQSYDDYPQAAVDNAQRALDWREEHGDEVTAGTRVGWTRANQLANREPISRETIGRMAAFRRHESNAEIADEYEGTPWRDAGYVAWLLWGGEAGVSWAERKMDEIDNVE